MDKPTKSVAQKIQEAKERQLTKLDLSHRWHYGTKPLNEIPAELFSLENLEILELSGNGLTVLPESISQLRKLTLLDLGSNKLTSLPTSLSRLENLTSLSLCRNGLSAVPQIIYQLEKLTSLDLSGNQLTNLPESIFRMRGLTSLNLGELNLTALPGSIYQLKNLINLTLDNNQLTDVPKSIAQLEKLTSLDLASNKLTSFPETITQLKKLTKLDLSGNNLGALPASISKLENLTSLNLNNTKLTSLPEALGKLQNLKELNLYGNRLTAIPEWISQLKCLTSLVLASNELTDLPDSITELECLASLNLHDTGLMNLPESISRMKALAHLYLAGSRIDRFPRGLSKLEHLVELNLDYSNLVQVPDVIYEIRSLTNLHLNNYDEPYHTNRIKALSPSILQLENLEEISLDKVPIEIPPPEVVANGAEAIKEYFRQLEAEGTDHLFEAKLLILGEGGAGKTSLARKIKDSQYVLREEESTKGIEVLRWVFPMDNGQSFRVNIWDFGGQEIYHATHQFFLTKRSLYVLVADSRKEDTDFYYWLNVVQLLSDHSPLLIVKNEKQDRQREINVNQLRGQFSNLKETLPTNLATNRGLDKILDEIKHYISRLPQIGAPLPKTWVRVREVLERDSRNYISLTEYLHLCQDNGFTELKDKMQLLGYLHDLGVCLHFQDDPLLRKTTILKPKWGTDAVYKVLDNKRVIANFGKFDRADLASIWNEPEYAEMQDELLQLMINFKLSYRIPNSELYIAPQLLTENQPDHAWEETSNLILRYTYEFMPKGIVTQFIVAMHRLIAQQDYVWKSGVILEKDETRAEIIEYYGKREIKVRAAGKRKKELMTIVMYELDKVNSSYARLKYSKLIPCNCSQCRNTQEPHFYRLETLQRFADNRRDLIQCEMSFDMVDVRGLIDDVIDKTEYVSLDQKKTMADLIRGQVFISYSHKDKEWLDQLQTMLRPLTRSGQVSAWADTQIKAGAKWRDEIEHALTSAKVAVLLVSKHFLASDFIAENELPPLLTAARERGLTILWVPVSDSMYKETEIAAYQAAANPAEPLDSLSPADANRVLVRICEQIKDAARV